MSGLTLDPAPYAPGRQQSDSEPSAAQAGSSGRRSSLTVQAFLSAGAVWLTLTAWTGFTQNPGSFLVPTLIAAVAIAAVGTACRIFGVAKPTTVLIQSVVVLAGIYLATAGAALPSPTGLERCLAAFSGALESARSYTSPIPAQAPGIHPLLIAGGSAFVLVCDLLVCTLRRAVLAGPPLVTIYLLPTAMSGTPVPWWVFVASTASFLALLFFSEAHLVDRWGRHLDNVRSRRSTLNKSRTSTTHYQRRNAIIIGSLAVAAAMLLSLAAPAWDIAGLGRGPGSGGGGSEITIESPMTDLRRDLTRGEDVTLLTVNTADPRPDYLRIAVLNRFSENAWTSGDRDFPNDQTARGQELPLTGIDQRVERRTYPYRISADDGFDSRWLPTPFPVTDVTADGTWKYDRTTLDFLAAQDGLTTSGLTYEATSVEIAHDAQELADAPSGTGAVSATFTQLPDDLPNVVPALATKVTKKATTKFEKAVALQEWFRNKGGFEYSLDTPAGTGQDELVAFLTRGAGGRIGYCEQFASAMAVMARTQGIPARVAVGFLRPERIDANQWEYSSWDLHAWPELYFPGAGWVRFEPTPSARAELVPRYTTQRLNRPEQNPSAGASPTAASSPRTVPRGGGRNLPDEPTVTTNPAASAWPRLAAVVVSGALILGLLLTPMTVRSLRRQRRWQRTDSTDWPEHAWAELQDTVIDLGRRWPGGLSPRETRNRLVTWFGASGLPSPGRGRYRRGNHVSSQEATSALDRLVLALEEARYSANTRPQLAESATIPDDVDRCVAALRAGTTPVGRRRARWWPRSVFRRRPSPNTIAIPADRNMELDQIS
ncbi:MAG: transglutaminaseTgpA domain-containing protein [Nocardioides sp.]